MPIVNNISIGKPDTKVTKSAHVAGVRMGNAEGNLKRERGIKDQGLSARGNARRSTSINPDQEEPIDPSMPHLSPA